MQRIGGSISVPVLTVMLALARCAQALPSKTQDKQNVRCQKCLQVCWAAELLQLRLIWGSADRTGLPAVPAFLSIVWAG